MPIATIAIDLAKSVFEVAAADENGRIVERRRLTRGQLVRYFSVQPLKRLLLNRLHPHRTYVARAHRLE